MVAISCPGLLLAIYQQKMVVVPFSPTDPFCPAPPYQTDELASDTDDDRKIRRAEKAALEKKKQWKTGGFLPTAVKSLPNRLSTDQYHSFHGYKGRPQSYQV